LQRRPILKRWKKKARKHVADSVKEAKKGSEMEEDEVYTDIYLDEVPSFIRGAEVSTSLVDGKVAH